MVNGHSLSCIIIFTLQVIRFHSNQYRMCGRLQLSETSNISKFLSLSKVSIDRNRTNDTESV